MRRHVRPPRAQGITEYALILALISILAIIGLVVLGPAIASLLTNMSGSI